MAGISKLDEAKQWSAITHVLSLAAGAYVMIGGAVSLLGWMIAFQRLTDWFGRGITIKANPAICMMAAGAGLLVLQSAPAHKWLTRVLGLVVAVIAGLTLFEHISGIDVGIDTFFFDEDPFAPATSSPGRMGIPASTSLTAIGVGLILATFDGAGRRWASILAAVALSISCLSLAGYLFGADQFFAIPRLTGIALQTATMIAAAAIGILAAIPEKGIAASLGRDDAGGVVFRRLLLPVVILSLFIGWLRLVGQQAGLYDDEFGAAAGTIIEIALFLGLLWLTVNGISRAEVRARDASEALAEREERLRSVLDSLTDAFMTVDRDFRFTYANAAIKRIWTENGLTDTNLIGISIFDAFPQARKTLMGQALYSVTADRKPVELEEFYEPFGRWYLTRCFPTTDGGVSIFAHDITDRKQSEAIAQRRTKEITALFAFTDRLQRAVSMEEVYQAALDSINGALACDRASILLFDDEGVMRFAASRGLSGEYQNAVTGHSPWKKGETDAKPLGIENIETADVAADLRSAVVREGIAALGFVPLISNGILIGKCMVYYDEPHQFTEAEFDIAMTVAYQIAFGLERKRTEESLRENEERLRLATQTGKVGVWDWDITADHVSWTDAVYKMHGVALGQFDGSVESFAALVHPDDREFVNGRIQRALSGEEPYEIEFRVAKPDGGINWLFTNAMVLRSEEGPYRMIGATIDITELKRAEQESATLAAIVGSSADAIISKDLNGIIKSWNQGAQRLFGYTPDEAIGQPVTMLMPPERVNEEAGILARVQAGEYTEHYETVRRHKDGTALDISLTVSPVTDASGRIIGASKIARDITERRRTEAAIRDREIMQRLVETQEAERHRIARDLHDHLGQQLTALRLKLESVRAMCGDNAELIDEVNEMQKFAARLDLDINYLAWELRPTELDQLGLQDALRSFVREWSQTYGIAADFHSTVNIDGRLHADLETNLYRIVQEALNNILKHAKATTVSVLLDERGDRIVLIIEDNGDGFEPKSTAKNGSSGKGLGLIGMRERTALLGGAMEIESRPGDGTTIYARVPLRSAVIDG